MHKCSAGDLAVIVYAYNTVNIGAIVRVLTLHPNQKQIQSHPDDILWTCKASHPMTYSVGDKRRKRKTGPVPDSYLQPIRGEPIGMDIAMGVVIAQIKEEQKDIDRKDVYI